jgi:hypothetical protein
MYEKVEVWEQNEGYGYRNNGAKFRIRFLGTNKNPGQYEIVSSETTPLVGDPDTPLTFIKSTLIPQGQNLFYDAIPFETLKTYETWP